MSDPLLAIVGRPNVGKSTLFNRLVGGRPALVHDTPGLTRDRRYGETDYFGTVVRLVDTGGLDMDAASEVIGAGIHRQAMRAIDEADAVLLVVDGRAGLSAVDHELAAKLRTSGKKLFLAVNKIDHEVRNDLVHEFHALGLGEPMSISAAHGRGIDALLETITNVIAPKAAPSDEDDEEASSTSDDLFDVLASAPEPEEIDPDDEEARDAAERAKYEAREAELAAQPLRIVFVGRPNAGKSSLTNRLLGEERSLVHDVAGTTTDPVDTPFSIGGRDYVLVDTAGIRRKARIEVEIEKIAVSMAIGQLARADVAVLVIDAELGPSEQDARIAGMVEDSGRALVIALNKSDRIKGDEAKTKLRDLTEETFHFLTWAPTVMLSAQRGDGVDRLLDVVDKVAGQHRKRIRTAELNRFFKSVIEEMPPPLHRGRAVKINYITQATSRPPTFVLWVSVDALSPQYKRFIANRLRETYGFNGTPIRVAMKVKKDRHKQD